MFVSHVMAYLKKKLTLLNEVCGRSKNSIRYDMKIKQT